MTLTRTSKLYINEANPGKFSFLMRLTDEMLRVNNLSVKRCWDAREGDKPSPLTEHETWLSERIRSDLLATAHQIVAGVRSRAIQGEEITCPEITDMSFSFEGDMVSLEEAKDSRNFDFWIVLRNMGTECPQKLILPTKRHDQFNRYYGDGWAVKNTVRLCRRGSRVYVVVAFEKEAPNPQYRGSVEAAVGVDSGYTHAYVSSSGQFYGEEIRNVHDKLARRQKGSKGYRRAQQERINLIGRSANEMMSMERPSAVFIERLKGSKTDSHLQGRRYSLSIQGLRGKCEERGILVRDVPREGTTYTCSICGHIDKASLMGTKFRCVHCGYESDAKVNAAASIFSRGVSIPFAQKKAVCLGVPNRRRERPPTQGGRLTATDASTNMNMK